MKFTSILVMIFFLQAFFSQEVKSELLEEIYTGGKAYSTPLKEGQIESLKNANPPKDTWTYSKLEEYKSNLNSENIIYGEIIMPSVDELNYSYNLFAYDLKKETYYFVVVVSFEIIEDAVKMNDTYLFTEKKSLTGWWQRIFSFYQSDLISKTPEKYLFRTCPPPPFRD